MKRNAFTLVETLVVVTVVTIVGLAVQMMIQRFYIGNAYVLQGTAAVNSARTGVTTLASNLRDIAYGDDGSFPSNPAHTSSDIFSPGL